MHPILFSLGPLHIYSYGVLVAMGVLTAIFLLRSSAVKVQINPDVMVDLAIVTVVSGFVGARIFYVIQFWNYFKASPIDVFKIWEGGIVVYGGIIGGLIGFSSFIKLRRLPFLPLLDLFVPALALAQGFGRFGCFLNGCCFGKPTTSFWGVSFPFSDLPLHPTQLYEATFCFSLAVFLLFLSRKSLPTGSATALYFILYPTGRFLIEFVRGDNMRVFLNLTVHQWISIGVIIIALLSVLFFKFAHGKNKRTHRSP